MALTEEALYSCYRRLEKPLYNVLYRWLWQPQDCQDLLHDAFARVWAARARVEAASIDTLVWRTALNLCRNRLRWRALWRTTDLAADTMADDDPLVAAMQAQRDAMLRAAITALPRAMREVLLLSTFGGLGIAQIAEVLKIPAGTVGSRKHQALARLRRALDQEST